MALQLHHCKRHRSVRRLKHGVQQRR